MAEVTGGCACGAIRYEVAIDDATMFNCHCRDCQRASGSGYSAVVYVPAKAFKITKGLPTFYTSESESGGHNVRGFCSRCGSRLFGGVSEAGVGITAGSLDDPGLFQPNFDIFTADAQRWDSMDPVLPKSEKYPTA